MTLPPRVQVTPTDIDRVTARFYQRVRQDPQLGLIFASHVSDWDAHEDKIGRFWRNALLFQRTYDGNPMQIHKAAGNVRPEHFARWLALFDQVLADELPAQQARAWSALAHRIGRGLRLGLHTADLPDLS